MSLFPTFSKAAVRLTELTERAVDALRFSMSGQYRRRSRAPRDAQGRLPGSDRDWEREAGNVWDNSAVSILLRWFCNTFCESPLIVKRLGNDGTFEEVPLHEVATRVKRPNRHFTRTQLLKATLLSYFVDGNAYWRKRRSRAGKVVELWWTPHWLIEPRWSDDPADWLEGGDAFVSYYEYEVDGVIERIAPADIIHFKEGADPANYRKGLAPLKALFREVCTDNQILTYTFGIMKNAGVPPYVLTPADESYEVDNAVQRSAKASWRKLTTGDNAGDVMVMDGAWKLEKVGFSPKDLSLADIGELSEARLAGAFNLPAITVQLLVGLRHSNAKASHKESKLQAYESGIMPVQRDFCETLDRHLIPELGDEMRECCHFDTSQVAALRENQNEIATRANAGFVANVLKLNEARTMQGAPADDVLDGYAWEIVPASSFGVPPAAEEDDVSQETDEDEEDENEIDEAVEKASKKARKSLLAFWRVAGKNP